MRLLALSLIALFSFVSPVFSGPKEEKLRLECLKPTVCIWSPQSHTAGSGFVVRSALSGKKYHNVVLTANHCMSPKGDMIRVFFYDDRGAEVSHKDYPAFCFAGKKEFDLGVMLFISDEQLPCVKLGLNSPIEFGQKVHRIGFGLGDDARLDEGKITGVHSKVPVGFDGYIRTNIYTTFGDSGGPLFNKKNEVVGVTHAVRGRQGTPYFNHSYFSPISWVKTWDDSTNHLISFVYKPSEKLPTLAFIILKVEQYEGVN